MTKHAKKIRFIMVGTAATSIDFGLLFVGRYVFGLPVISANIISTTTAFCFSFVANKKYTFKSHGTNVVREMVLFSVVTLFGLWVIQTIIIALALPVAESFAAHAVALFLSKLLATGVTLIWNYVLYSKVVFKHAHDE